MLQTKFAFFQWLNSTINGLMRRIKFMPRWEVDRVDGVDKVDKVDGLIGLINSIYYYRQD